MTLFKSMEQQNCSDTIKETMIVLDRYRPRTYTIETYNHTIKNTDIRPS